MVVHVFHAVPALGCAELETNILFSPLLWGWAPWDITESKHILALHPWGGGGCIAGELQGEMLSGRTMFILCAVPGDTGAAKRLHPGPSENVT